MLRKNTADAVASGICGFPTFQIGQDLVWGQDRLDVAADLLFGWCVPFSPGVNANNDKTSNSLLSLQGMAGRKSNFTPKTVIRKSQAYTLRSIK